MFIKIFCFIVLFSISINAIKTKDGIESLFVSEEEKIYLEDVTGTKNAPKILLFNCHYGAGHKMATQGIVERLPECSIQVVDVYDEPLRSLDPMRDIAPELSNESLYNKMAKEEQNHILNLAGRVGSKVFTMQRPKIEKLLMEYVTQNKPDLMISCVPLVNSMLYNVAKKLDIPFLVITTDIDLSAFCYGFEGQDCFNDKSKFRITVPFAMESWYPRFGNNLPDEIKSSLQYQFGYPTRRAFSEIVEESVLEQLRDEYQIQPDENVILVMMGGNTAQAALSYCELFQRMTDQQVQQIVGDSHQRNKIRLICLCGDISQEDNRAFMNQLNALNFSNCKLNHRVHVHACAGTSKIAELVSLPELCVVISKPGGSTVNEMIKKKVPMIYHVSGVPLDWERCNMEYGESQDLGMRFQMSGKIREKTKRNFVHVLTHLFELHKNIQMGVKNVPEAKFDFASNIRSAVREMVLSNHSRKPTPQLRSKAVPINSTELSNWYKIDDLIYRSAQPNEKGLELIQRSGIKRIINLRQFHSDNRIAAKTDLQLFHVGVNPGNIKDSEMIKVLKIIKSSKEPILVHCWHGSDRTGVVIALYRILFQNWDKEWAIDEMVNGGFGYHEIYQNLIKYIRNVDVAKLRYHIEKDGD